MDGRRGRKRRRGGSLAEKIPPLFPLLLPLSFLSRPSGSGTEAVCPSHLPPRPDCRAKNQFGDGGGREGRVPVSPFSFSPK